MTRRSAADDLMSRQDRLIALVTRHPGLDGIALKGQGYRPAYHGSLRDAERAGRLMYRNGGWYLAAADDVAKE